MPIAFPPNVNTPAATQLFVAAPRIGDILRPALSSAYRCDTGLSDDIDRLMQQLDRVPSVQRNDARDLTIGDPD
ncbi:MAG: hypothetical protein EOP67_67420 [Sphingomonas sp.]|nr:MAG: hypothetical protein EOP67_67420 [Sphingomonas sp.]